MGITKKKMKTTTWNTYAIRGYTYDVANDQASAGGIHAYEVRQHPRGGWQERIRQTNGGHTSFSPVQPIDEQDGWAKFETAKTFRG